mmetsp:Transcript_29385/g.70881  ORF Transcript_29385/g.70881 Transcript_29385/m.70881 type:complete len:80 (-) Transcript_29385:522-761(-)
MFLSTIRPNQTETNHGTVTKQVVYSYNTYMFIPQFFRASSQRWYAVLVRKTNNKPSDEDANVNGANGSVIFGKNPINGS